MEKGVNTVLPMYFAPNIDWFSEAMKGTEIRIGAEERFLKQTYRNRIEYGTFQGTKIFTVPLIHQTTSGCYLDVQISYQTNWQNQLINALRTAYGKSPFFEYYGYRFEAILLKKLDNLWLFNYEIILEIMKCLKLNLPLIIQPSEAITNTYLKTEIQYYQVFEERLPFQPHLSILDLIFNEGPTALEILNKMSDLDPTDIF